MADLWDEHLHRLSEIRRRADEEAMAAELRRRGYTVTPPDDSDVLAAQALAAGLPVGRYWHDPVTHEDTPLGWEEPSDG